MTTMIDDISAIPVTNQEPQEFGLEVVATSLLMIIIAVVAKQKKVRAFHHWLYLSLRRKTFFVTERGYMGIGLCLNGGRRRSGVVQWTEDAFLGKTGSAGYEIGKVCVY